ncbi:MAG: hypothetical protein OQK50_00630 [Deltaproteobacteria bacterium]|nr:hypothetical protein [Deltaproteobacteria bacterium]MCW8892072.1 hypothetical protein [Deltaproteobacteria bacterium]MCW9048816.1 hypothetical protein [Deltaproteobacteria bacterium]
MRIAGNSSASVPSTATLNNRKVQQQQVLQARDSYTRNAAFAQVIDAEYVEFYTPGKTAFTQERQKLDLSLAPEPAEIGNSAKNPSLSNTRSNRYQTPSLDTPPPGTYLNVFA